MLDYSTYKRLEKCRFVLASTSPRRLEILTEMGVADIEVIASDFEENLSKDDRTPEEYVAGTALGKIDSVLEKIRAEQGEGAAAVVAPGGGPRPVVILGADTIVVNSGKIYEKPQDKATQVTNLKGFRTSPSVEVITAIWVYRLGGVGLELQQKAHRVVTSRLTFDSNLSDEFLQAYADSEEGLNAAGGFKIQGIGGLLWRDLQGDYRNVIGLPFKDSFEMLEEVLEGIEVE